MHLLKTQCYSCNSIVYNHRSASMESITSISWISKFDKIRSKSSVISDPVKFPSEIPNMMIMFSTCCTCCKHVATWHCDQYVATCCIKKISTCRIWDSELYRSHDNLESEDGTMFMASYYLYIINPIPANKPPPCYKTCKNKGGVC